jgi:hypothetical protein
VCEAVSGFDDFAGDDVGRLRECVAALARLLGRVEHDVVEPVLLDALDAELDGDEFFPQAQSRAEEAQ